MIELEKQENFWLQLQAHFKQHEQNEYSNKEATAPAKKCVVMAQMINYGNIGHCHGAQLWY